MIANRINKKIDNNKHIKPIGNKKNGSCIILFSST